MFKHIYGIIAFLAVALFFSALAPSSAKADDYCIHEDAPGFISAITDCSPMNSALHGDILNVREAITVKNANCDPSGDCTSELVDYTNFTVTINFKPSINFVGPDEEDATLEVSYDDDIKDYVSAAGADFKLQKTGSQACIYVSIAGGVLGKLGANDDTLDALAVEAHCIDIPPPPAPDYTGPAWSGMVAAVCTDFSKRSSKHSMPFSSIVVECVEDTMHNLFTLNRDNQGGGSGGGDPL